MKLHRVFALAVAISLLLTACVPLPAPGQPGPATPGGELTPSQPVATPFPAAAAAQGALAAELGIATDQIAIVSAEQVEWPDACLGAAAEGDMCAQVITPGYRIVLEANGKQYEAHTDETGRVVRIVTP
jgi:hypothetical protein